MTPHIAAQSAGGGSGHLEGARALGALTFDASRTHRAQLRPSVPRAWRLTGTALLGAAAAAGVALAISNNPAPHLPHDAALVRVLIIASLFGGGIFAQTNEIQARMGALLVAAGIYASLWLLNGSNDPALFSIGAVFAGLGPVVLAFLMLAHPTGRLRSSLERAFLGCAGGAVVGLWILALLLAKEPPLKGPLMRCAPHCPRNVFSVGSMTAAPTALRDSIVAALIAVFIGTAMLVTRRWRDSALPLRRSIAPVWLLSLLTALTGLLYIGSVALDPGSSSDLAAPYLLASVAIPLVILIGLTAERLSMAHVLADLVNELASQPTADPEVVMSVALGDPSLTIAYERPRRGTYVDSAGEAVAAAPEGRAVTLIERRGCPIAAVSYNAELHGQERFIQAAAAAAMMRLQQTHLEAELRASLAELTASRARVVTTADAERERLERDLHDGVQQQLVALRINLDRVAEAIKHDPEAGEHKLAAMGRDMDETIRAVRNLSRGIYPALLRDRGLTEALRSAARSTPIPATVTAKPVGRYPETIEVAVYYCCVEALQNAAKHAGRGASAVISLWRDGSSLRFEVRDTGKGFDPAEVPVGKGLINMRDRIETTGGTMAVTSSDGHGTTVAGSVHIGIRESPDRREALHR